MSFANFVLLLITAAVIIAVPAGIIFFLFKYRREKIFENEIEKTRRASLERGSQESRITGNSEACRGADRAGSERAIDSGTAAGIADEPVSSKEQDCLEQRDGVQIQSSDSDGVSSSGNSELSSSDEQDWPNFD